jgi:hypothetical protein
MEGSQGLGDEIQLRMSGAEALVLFEWVHRHEDENVRLEHLVNDPAELAVLREISGSLERLLAEPFAEDYAERLEAARATLRPAAE